MPWYGAIAGCHDKVPWSDAIAGLLGAIGGCRVPCCVPLLHLIDGCHLLGIAGCHVLGFHGKVSLLGAMWYGAIAECYCWMPLMGAVW